MDATLQAVFFLGSMAASALVFIPLFVKIKNVKKRRVEERCRFAEEHGGKVVARYVQGSRSTVESYKPNGDIKHGKDRKYAKYYYYGPDNKKYTKTFGYNMRLPQEFEIYVDPHNPKKVYTEYGRRNGGSNFLLLLLLYPVILVAGWKLFRFLCTIFG